MRSVLFHLKAVSLDDAIQKAETEALDYADEESGLKYLGHVNVFKLFDEKTTDKTEAFSLMRESGLDAKEYINKYFDSGEERTKR